MHDEVAKLNEVFIKNMNYQACFVALKTATTLDGKIATKTGSSKWITSLKDRNECKISETDMMQFLTTSSTIIKDNPSMICTLKNGENPIKIILDRELKTDFNSKIYNTSGEKIYIVVDRAIEEAKIATIPTHVVVIKCPVYNYRLDLEYLFKKLYELEITSIWLRQEQNSMGN